MTCFPGERTVEDAGPYGSTRKFKTIAAGNTLIFNFQLSIINSNDWGDHHAG